MTKPPLPLLVLIQPRLGGEVSIPLDIAWVLGSLDRSRHEIRVFDLNLMSAAEEAGLYALMPRAQGVFVSAYCVSILKEERDWPRILTLARALRRHGARQVIVGSRHPIRDSIWADEASPSMEGVRLVTGDLERLLPALLSAEAAGATPGLPDFSAFDLGRYPTSLVSGSRPALPLLTSRGCDRKCAYCYVRRSYEPRPAAQVIEELRRHVQSFGIRHFIIEDDLFNHDPRHVRELCAALASSGLSLTWECLNGLHPENLAPELLDLMKGAGCVHVALGVEAFRHERLEGSGRVLDLRKLEALLEHARRIGLLTTGYFLLDIGAARWGQWISELRAIKASPLDFPHFSFAGKSGPCGGILKRACYLYAYLEPRRLRTLRALGAFSKKKFHRLWHKWKRG